MNKNKNNYGSPKKKVYNKTRKFFNKIIRYPNITKKRIINKIIM